MAGHADLVLGLDVSTQSLKAVFLELAPSSSGDDEDVPPPIALPSAATVAAAHTLDAPTTLAPGSRMLAEIEVPYRDIWPPERVLTCSPTTHRVTQPATMVRALPTGHRRNAACHRSMYAVLHGPVLCCAMLCGAVCDRFGALPR
ncbi:MAG: hypothetical protein EOO41_01555 [Methanobacteriota archaeon]|nr:MAG: hypothetical protein EOO41_01555 [Euryarchaeota archaeon]